MAQDAKALLYPTHAHPHQQPGYPYALTNGTLAPPPAQGFEAAAGAMPLSQQAPQMQLARRPGAESECGSGTRCPSNSSIAQGYALASDSCASLMEPLSPGPNAACFPSVKPSASQQVQMQMQVRPLLSLPPKP